MLSSLPTGNRPATSRGSCSERTHELSDWTIQLCQQKTFMAYSTQEPTKPTLAVPGLMPFSIHYFKRPYRHLRFRYVVELSSRAQARPQIVAPSIRHHLCLFFPHAIPGVYSLNIAWHARLFSIRNPGLRLKTWSFPIPCLFPYRLPSR